MKNVHVVYIITYIYKLVVIIILSIHEQYFKTDVCNRNQNK